LIVDVAAEGKLVDRAPWSGEESYVEDGKRLPSPQVVFGQAE
jgi:hypothetical protein